MGSIRKNNISIKALKKKYYFVNLGLQYLRPYASMCCRQKLGRLIMVTPTTQTPPKPVAPAPVAPKAAAPAAGTVHKPGDPAAAPAGAAQTPTPADASAPTNGQTEGEGKKKKTKTGVARPRLPKFDETHVITVLRPGAKIRESGKRYDEYVNGMTVKAYIEKMTAEPWKRTVGQVYADLRWDTDPNRKLINIGPEVVPIPPPPPPKEKKEKAKAETTAAAAEAPKSA
jgi:hypothetical protein